MTPTLQKYVAILSEIYNVIQSDFVLHLQVHIKEYIKDLDKQKISTYDCYYVLTHQF